MKGDRDDSTWPAFKDLRNYCRICRLISDRPKTPLKNMGPLLGLSDEEGASDILARLEQRGGGDAPVKLIHRPTRGKKWITPAGKRFWRDAEELLYRHQQIGLRYDATGITVGVTNAVLVFFLPEPLRRFLADSPKQQRVNWIEASPRELLLEVATSAAEFAVGPLLRDNPHDNVRVDPLAKLKTFAICHPSHPWAVEGKKSLVPADFASEQFLEIPPEEQPGLFEEFPTNFGAGGRRIVMRNFTSIVASVRAGVGVSVMPLLPILAEDSGLYPIPIVSAPKVELAAYLPQGGRGEMSGSAARLLDCCRDWFAEKSKSESRVRGKKAPGR